MKFLTSKIHDLSIEDGISKYITLKKKGANYQACCPFHDEKTPSLSVSPVKGIFTCFGCGAKGDLISFVMQHQKLEFIEAIKHIADDHGIPYEEKQYTPQEKKVIELKRLTVQEILEVNKSANEYFINSFLEDSMVQEISYNKTPSCQIHKEFMIGYAPNKSQGLYLYLKEKGYSLDVMVKAGIVRKGTSRNYDFFQDRIIYPITNRSDDVIGFGGKYIGKKANMPKYLNTAETEAYDKSSTLYGLSLASKSINEFDYVNIVEGYTDVHMMNLAGAKNTVACCGTAITIDHIKLLKKYSKTVNLMLDGDNAGINASNKAGKEFLTMGCHVSITPLPYGQDPCDLFRPSL